MKEFNLPPLVSSVYGKPKDNEIFAVLLPVPKQIISGDILSGNTAVLPDKISLMQHVQQKISVFSTSKKMKL